MALDFGDIYKEDVYIPLFCLFTGILSWFLNFLCNNKILN